MTHNTSLYYLWKNNTPTPSECAIEIYKGDICILGRSDGLTTVYVDKEIDASLNWEDLYVVDSYSEYNLNLSHDPITLCEIGRDGKILGDVIALNTLKGLYRSEWMYDFFSETENILNGSIRHWSKSLLSRIISIEEIHFEFEEPECNFILHYLPSESDVSNLDISMDNYSLIRRGEDLELCHYINNELQRIEYVESPEIMFPLGYIAFTNDFSKRDKNLKFLNRFKSIIRSNLGICVMNEAQSVIKGIAVTRTKTEKVVENIIQDEKKDIYINNMNPDEIIKALNEEYSLRDMLKSRNYPVPDEINKRIKELETNYINNYILPQLESFSTELLSGFNKDLVLSINKDINGVVSVHNESVDIEDIKRVKQVTKKPETEITRKRSIGFTVKFEDGTIIKEDKAIFTFVNALKKIGLARIANEHPEIQHSGYSLVGTRKYEATSKKQEFVDGYYVYTNISNDDKISDLLTLSNYYSLNLVITKDADENGETEVITRKSRAINQPSYDHTLYRFEGSEPMNKRRFAHAAVKKYVEDHPNVNYEALKVAFPPQIIGARGVVRSIMDLNDIKQDEIPKRYLMDDNDLIELNNDDIITVCSQWNVERMNKMVKVVRDLGYTVEEVKENL